MMPEQGILAAALDAPELLNEFGDLLDTGVLVLDADLVVRGCNRWLQGAAACAADVVGRSVFEVFPETQGGPAEAAFRHALGGMITVLAQRFHEYLLPLAPPAGFEQRFAYMQQSARVIPLVRDDRVCGVLALVQDVTERVAREEELRAATVTAEIASRAKSEFLASISHELRTPLSAVIGYMDLLEGEMVGPILPAQRNYLSRVRAAARHLLQIIEEILTFSRVEAGKEEVHLEQVDSVGLAHEVEVLLEPDAVKKGIELRVLLPETPILMRTDPTKLRQILFNLLGNALKFTDEGVVTLELSSDNDRTRFVVRDTGPGIAADDLERVFEPFTQVDGSWKRSKGGTGLGLPVSRRLSEMLGGTLTVESEPGHGASFLLTLPNCVAPPAYAPPEGARAMAGVE